MWEEMEVAEFYWKGAELFLTLSCRVKTCTYVPSPYFWAELIKEYGEITIGLCKMR